MKTSVVERAESIFLSSNGTTIRLNPVNDGHQSYTRFEVSIGLCHIGVLVMQHIVTLPGSKQFITLDTPRCWFYGWDHESVMVPAKKYYSSLEEFITVGLQGIVPTEDTDAEITDDDVRCIMMSATDTMNDLAITTLAAVLNGEETVESLKEQIRHEKERRRKQEVKYVISKN